MRRWTSQAIIGLASIPFLFAPPLLAQETGATEAAIAPPAAPAAPAGPALWKIADEDTTIYLFGTVHILPKDLEWLDASITDALAKSDIIITELPMDPGSETELQQLTMTKGMLPKGTTLRSLLSAEQVTIYEGALAKLGVPAAAFAQFDPMKPWFAGMTFSVLPLMQQGYSPDSGVEKVLLGIAGDKERGALETPAFQLSIFDNLPEEAQISFFDGSGRRN